MTGAEITIVSHADNRGQAHHATGKPEPLVQVLISIWGDVYSVSFTPEQAPEIARAILKAGLAATRGKDTERKYTIAETQ